MWVEITVTAWILKTLQFLWIEIAVTKWMLKLLQIMWTENALTKWILKTLWFLWAEIAVICVSWKRLRLSEFWKPCDCYELKTQRCLWVENAYDNAPLDERRKGRRLFWISVASIFPNERSVLTHASYVVGKKRK